MKKRTIAIAFCVIAVVAGYFWRQPGIVTSSKATVESRMVTVVAAASGVIKDVLVAEGDTVVAGQLLFRLDASIHEKNLVRERERLSAIASTLPAGRPLPSTPRPDPQENKETKTLVQMREEEEQARIAVEKASDEAAAAAVILTRLRSLEASGKLVDSAQKNNAQNKHEHAKARLAESRKAYERTSYARATHEAENRAALAGKGDADSPLARRTVEYQAQLSLVHAIEQELAATRTLAPEGGTIHTMTIRPGFAVETGDIAATILANNEKDLWVTAFFPKSAYSKLTAGQKCSVTLGSSGKTIPGILGTVVPPSPDNAAQAPNTVTARIFLMLSAETPAPAMGEAATVHIDIRQKNPDGKD